MAGNSITGSTRLGSANNNDNGQYGGVRSAAAATARVVVADYALI